MGGLSGIFKEGLISQNARSTCAANQGEDVTVKGAEMQKLHEHPQQISPVKVRAQREMASNSGGDILANQP